MDRGHTVDSYCLITYRCTNNCIFCATGRHTGELKFGDVKKFLDQNALPNGKIIVTGGEPTVHPDFIKILKYIKETFGATTSILSNSARFADPKFADEACKYLDIAQCSFYAHNPAMFDYVCRSRGAYDRTVSGIRNLIDRGVEVHICTLVNVRPTYQHLEKTVETIHNLFDIDAIEFTGVDVSGNVDDAIGVIVPLSRAQPFIERAIAKTTSLGITPITYFYPLCLLQKKYRKLQTHHRMTARLNTYISHDSELHDARGYDRGYGERCNGCYLRNECGGVWGGYLRAFGDSELRPVRKQ